MERINHSSAVDIGGGRNGFRSKDTVAGIPGTVVTATHLNASQEEMVAIIEKAGLVPDGADLAQLVKAIRSQATNFRVAGGTANALTITLDPAPTALAQLLGVPLRIKAAATNTGAVTLAVNGLVATAVRGADGLVLLKDEVPADTIFEVAYTGAFFQIINRPVPAAQRTPAAFVMTTSALQSISASTYSQVTNFQTVLNDTVDSTLAVNSVTIGAKDAGWWAIAGKLMYDFPASGTMYSNIVIERNSAEIGAGNSPGTTSIRARPQASIVHKLAAGDVIRLMTTSDIARNLVVSGGFSIFSGFKIGA